MRKFLEPKDAIGQTITAIKARMTWDKKKIESITLYTNTGEINISASTQVGCNECDPDSSRYDYLNIDVVLGGYSEKPPDYADIMTVERFKKCGFTMWDGTAHPMKDGMENDCIHVNPEDPNTIPADATHIAWYNK